MTAIPQKQQEDAPVVLNYTPRPWQQHCHEHKKRFNVHVLHRRAGKSEDAIVELLDAAIGKDPEKYPLPRYAYVAPTLAMAKKAVWDRLLLKADPLIKSGDAVVNESDHFVLFKWNSAKLQIFGAKNPDELRGPHLDGVVVDELAQVEPRTWTEIISPMLADRLGWAIFTGTVKGVDLLSELYTKHLDDPEWFCYKATCYETGALAAQEIERMRGDMSPAEFAREMLCDLNVQGDDQLISLALAMQAAHRSFSISDQLILSSPVILGVDPARFGDDRSVIMRRQGLQMFDPIIMRGVDQMTLAARVADQIKLHNPSATFIDAGMGAGVIDRLRQLGFSVVEVPFAGQARKSKQFVNRRAEMWWAMREWLELGGAIPNDQSLIRELATPVYWTNNRDQKVLEPKDEIKRRLPMYGSPDIADAAVLTFASEVGLPRNSQDPFGRLFQRTKPKEHNPLLNWRER